MIIGRLIPAGTGFNSYSENSSTNQLVKLSNINLYENSSRETDSTLHFNSLVLDDKVARNYPFIDTDTNLAISEDITN